MTAQKDSDRTPARVRPEKRRAYTNSITRNVRINPKLCPPIRIPDIPGASLEKALVAYVFQKGRQAGFWEGWDACEEFYAHRLRELDKVDPSTADWLRNMWGLPHEGD